MEFIVQNLQLVGPISLALVPVSVIGLIVINLRKRARS